MYVECSVRVYVHMLCVCKANYRLNVRRIIVLCICHGDAYTTAAAVTGAGMRMDVRTYPSHAEYHFRGVVA